MAEWLKGCEVCDAGLCARVDELKGEGMSERKATEILENDQREILGEVIYTGNSLRRRYQRIRYGAKCATPPLKYGQAPGPNAVEFTQAMHIAIFAISHLERIMADDPEREAALNKVKNWVDQNLKGGSQR